MSATLCAAVLLASVAAAQGRPQPIDRRYEAGPLTADDFRGAVPQPLPTTGRFQTMAKADSDIRYSYKCTLRKAGSDIEAKLSEIDIYAVFLPETSWHAKPADKALMAHEQGHFDLTQIHALEALLNFRKQLAEGKQLVGSGRNEKVAQADLEKQLRAILKPVYDRAAIAQQEYDRITSSGTDAAEQADQRQRQLKLLGELTKEVAPAEEN